jgi:hypothetical protein
MLAKFAVPVAVKLPVIVSPKFAILANKFVKLPVIEFNRFANKFVDVEFTKLEFVPEILVIVAFVALRFCVFVVVEVTELNTGLLEKEYVTLPSVSVATVKLLFVELAK